MIILVEDPEKCIDAQQTIKAHQGNVGLHQLAQDGRQRVATLEGLVARQGVRVGPAHMVKSDGTQ